MRKPTSIRTLIHVCLLSLTVQACSTLPTSDAANDSGQYESADVIYNIKKDDRLSDIALTLTGNISNWQLLAEYNNIADPKKLAVGDTVRIPRSMLMPVYEIGNGIQPQNSLRSASVAAASASSTAGGSTAIGNTMALQRAAEPTEIQAGPVVLHAISVNRKFDLIPYDRAASVMKSTPRFTPGATSVKVIGTYFPKGIYAGPANYTRLLMRVSPGTVFELDREINDWYKIVTDKGIGYLRSEDAELISDSSS